MIFLENLFNMPSSKNNPKVSVIIRCYNQAEYITQAINSARHQSFKNLEIIIIDDHSTDNSVDIIRGLANNDQRIKLILNQENLGGGQGTGGAGRPLNQCLAVASGKYTAILDGDDFWTDTNKTARQVEFLENNPDYVLVGSFVQNFDRHGTPLDKCKLPITDQALRSQILKSNPIAASSIMFHTAKALKVGGYPEKPLRAVDLGMWLKLGVIGKMYNIPEYWHGHRMTGVNIGEVNRHKQLDSALYHIKLHRHSYPNFYQAWLRHQLLRFMFRLPNPVIKSIRLVKNIKTIL